MKPFAWWLVGGIALGATASGLWCGQYISRQHARMQHIVDSVSIKITRDSAQWATIDRLRQRERDAVDSARKQDSIQADSARHRAELAQRSARIAKTKRDLAISALVVSDSVKNQIRGIVARSDSAHEAEVDALHRELVTLRVRLASETSRSNLLVQDTLSLRTVIKDQQESISQLRQELAKAVASPHLGWKIKLGGGSMIAGAVIGAVVHALVVK